MGSGRPKREGNKESEEEEMELIHGFAGDRSVSQQQKFLLALKQPPTALRTPGLDESAIFSTNRPDFGPEKKKRRQKEQADSGEARPASSFASLPFVQRPTRYFTSTAVDGVKVPRSCGPISTVTFLSPAALRDWARSTIWMFWFPNVFQWYCFFFRSATVVHEV